jgi:hypothetical protein
MLYRNQRDDNFLRLIPVDFFDAFARLFTVKAVFRSFHVCGTVCGVLWWSRDENWIDFLRSGGKPLEGSDLGSYRNQIELFSIPEIIITVQYTHPGQ